MLKAMQIRLQELGRVIAGCWDRAELRTQKAIPDKHPQPSEEELTFLFSGELRCVVEEASAAGMFSDAFKVDLKRHFSWLTSHDLRSFSGLIARVNFHTRSHEGLRSAADLGIAMTRPQVQCLSDRQFRVFRNSARALLVQAKLGRCSSKQPEKSKWGRLTKQQKKLIPGRESYYALLLYRLDAERNLARFGWQPCGSASVDEIEMWLRRGMFPNEMGSAQIVNGLAVGIVGTDCRSVIDRLVDPSSSRSTAIELRVFWPDDRGPSGAPMSDRLKLPKTKSVRPTVRV
jgi:hypothetical protein